MPPLDQDSLDQLISGDLEGQVINPFTTQIYEEIEETLDGFVGDNLDSDDLSDLIAQISALVDKAVTEHIETLKSELEFEDDSLSDDEIAALLEGDFIDANHTLTNNLVSLAATVVESKKQDEIVVQQIVAEYPEGSTVTYSSFSGTDTFTPDNTTSSITVDYAGFDKEITSGTSISFETEEDQYRDVQGTATLYSLLRENGVEDTSTGAFTATIHYEADLNRDGTLNFTSFLYEVGVGSIEEGVETYSFTRYKHRA
ncbi:hypothetical protein [Vibrio agarivorans]|uniref:hypothetical protein n=1 Tax=Vibrio agarivorans TaxID=153622 RepID=UPI002230F348|nr:hypothetical protein [Vibrio agarivorans]